MQRQQASLSAEALNKKGREFQQKVNDLDRSVQAKRQTLEKSNAEALESIQSVILKIITEIAKDRKANLVFQRSELVLFDNSFDVTDQVLTKLDEQLPTLTVSFAAETPASAEAQPAKPAALEEKAVAACAVQGGAAMADSRFFDRAGPHSLAALAELSGARLLDPADGGRLIGDVAPLETAGPDEVTFLDNRKYTDAFTRSRAGAAFVDERVADKAPRRGWRF